MSKIILYTTNCPKCKVLEEKLDNNHIIYEKETDVKKMISLGMLSAPFLQVDDKIMDFVQSNNWINERSNL